MDDYVKSKEKLMKMPSVSELAYNTFLINEYRMDAMFLLVGTEKALLIDTGTGVFDLPEMLKILTDKPVMVAITHGHVDHAGGAGWFDKIYLHPDDFNQASTIPYEQRKGYAGMLAMNPTAPVTPDDTVRFDSFPEMLPLHEGEVIDLGGRKVVVYETPGHTPGGLSFLDVRERIIYTGDACNINTLVLDMGIRQPKMSIETLLKTAEKLASLEPFYDRNYNGHVGYDAIASCRAQGYGVARDLASLCRDILSGKEKGNASELLVPGFPPIKTIHAIRGAAGVRYTESSIRE